MSEQIFKKGLLYRLSAYLLLLPFIPAIRPLINLNETKDLIIFISGILLTLTLIIFSNNKPYIRFTDKNLLIYLIHNHKPEIHYLSDIEKISIRTNKKFTIYSKGFEPLEIKLSKKEHKRIVDLFESSEIPVSKAYHN